MTQSNTAGGTARVIFAADGSITGSIIDEVWSHKNGAPRTGEVQGSVGFEHTVTLSIHWSSGQDDAYQGTFNSPGPTNLGMNLSKQDLGDPIPGTGMTFYLAGQGAVARPPYGAAPDAKAPDFLAQYVGRWTLNWYDSTGDWGTGLLTIAADGKASGTFVNDAFSDAGETAPMRSATVTGAIDSHGFLALMLQWGDATTETLTGGGYFEGPEEMTFTIGRDPRELATGGPRLVLTLSRR